MPRCSRCCGTSSAPTASFPAVDRNSLFFVYLPPGTAVVQGGSRSCQAFCGYHDVMDSDLFYAVVPYPGCQGCTGTLSVFDALTSVSSHELCEAVTDPVPGQGWYDDVNGEIGDVCAWQTRVVDGYTVQREWSNSEQPVPVTVVEQPSGQGQPSDYPGVWFQLSSAGRPCS